MFWAASVWRKLRRATKAYQVISLIMRRSRRIYERDGRSFAALRMNRKVLILAVLLLTACLPDPQRTQMARLLDQLIEARTALREQPPRIDAACDTVGEVENRLWGEPGLVDVKPAWPAMRSAADALLAVCGTNRLLQQPFEPTAAMLEARQRWQVGAVTQLDVACRSLTEAGQALGRGQVCPY